MPASNFGVGLLFGIPAGGTPTPQIFGALQDVSVDFSFDQKMLYGSFQFSIEQARGKGKMDIKAGQGQFDPVLFNSLFFGLSTTTGETRNSAREAGSIGVSPYQITVANGATFATNLGVYDVTAKKWMARVASGPTTGQYSLNGATGVYTFAAADTLHQVQFYYTYTSASTGSTLVYTNQLMGSGPIMGLSLINQNVQTGKYLYMNFNAVQSNKLSLPMKLDDYTIASMDMSAQDDGSGNLFTMSMTG